MDSAFSQLCVLGSSLVLIFGLILLWRRGVTAYINAFMWQSIVLAAVTVIVARFGNVAELYWVAVCLLLLKGLVIPRLLRRMERRFSAERELVLYGYAVTRPLVALSHLPTRVGVPLAMGLVLVSLFVVISRKKALTQVVGFLMLENGLALLAVLGTYGIPLIVELGVFLDALMGFLVMQIFIYQIHETFESIDVDQLNRLRH